jgi:hypothetical protein
LFRCARNDGEGSWALIGRLFVILFAFLAACLVAGIIVVGAVLCPEFSDLGNAPIDQNALNIVLGFGFIFISGFALLPALIVVLITEAFHVRGVLAYAVGGAVVGAACYLGLIPFDPNTLQFDGIVHRHLEIMTGRDCCRSRLLADRGPQCRRLARAAASPGAAAAAAAFAAAAVKTGISVIARSEADEAIHSIPERRHGLLRGACHRVAHCADPLARNDGGFHPQSPRLNRAP